MAHGAVVPGLTNGNGLLTAGELHEIAECKKIVRFRDAVLAGTHPRFRIPVDPLPKSQQTSSTQTRLPPSNTAPRDSGKAVAISEQNTTLPNGSTSKTTLPSASRPLNSVPQPNKVVVSEIDPILLEKSDELINAELNIRRQRVERVLKEQVEQKRIADKLEKLSDSIPDFDISEVLSKALSIVEHSAEGEVEQGAHVSVASDSFDEKTFYSSQHDTPDLTSPSQDGRDGLKKKVSRQSDLHSSNVLSPLNHDESRDIIMVDISGQQGPVTLPESSSQSKITLPSSHLGLSSALADEVHQSQSDSGYAVTPNSSNLQVSDVNSVIEPDANLQKVLHDSHKSGDVQTSEQLKRKFGAITASTDNDEPIAPSLIQAQNRLSPVAPQPSRISPLATARDPPLLIHDMVIDQPLPTAPSSTSQKETGISSPDSDPKAGKDKKKKKKKKAGKPGGKDSASNENPQSPYIKPEPLSPSPISAAPPVHSRKRQRREIVRDQGLNYDEPRVDESTEQIPHEELASHYEERPRNNYNGPQNSHQYQPREAQYFASRRPRNDPKDRRVVSDGAHRGPRSTDTYGNAPPRYENAFVRPDRVQHPRLARKIELPPGAIQIDLDPETSRSPVITQRRHTPIQMAPPPRLTRSRIVVDEQGREVYAYPQQVIPVSPQMIGNKVSYERPLVRSQPRQYVDLYEDKAGRYRRASPGLAAPMRRVFTQPEHVAQYQSYREYSSRPADSALPKEVIRVQAPARQVSYVEDVPQEFAPRVGSVRPDYSKYEVQYVQEVPRPSRNQYEQSVRGAEESSLQYAPRLGRVRPEAVRSERPQEVQRVEEPPREYQTRAPSVRPESYRSEPQYIVPRGGETPREYTRAGSVRPKSRIQERPAAHPSRAGSVRPESVYYDQPQGYSSIVESVRPEPRARHYSMRPEARREPVQEITYSGEHVYGRHESLGPSRSDYLPVQREWDYNNAPLRAVREVEYVEQEPRYRGATEPVYLEDGREVAYK